MTTTLIKHAHTLVTMDATRREIADGGVFIRGGVIEHVGPTDDLPDTADTVIDMTGHVVLPGLINTHHHMFQSLTRAYPSAQDVNLFNWLLTLYPVWEGIGAEAIYVSSLVAMAELMLSGCTTSSDHLYIFPNDARLDDQIQAATEIGLRFHAARGSMTLGQSKGGLPPDSLTEADDFVISDTQRLIETYHDGDRYAMLRIVIAPCAPFNVTERILRASVEMADAYDVRLHTHLAETKDEEEYCLEHYGKRPVDYMADLGWIQERAWHAHCVCLNDEEIDLFAQAKTGVAHCPTSNMRLASGIAPVVAMRARGVRVGLGVDGSASNDGGHLLTEARMAMLLQRVGTGDPVAMTARDALETATLGGASVLGRDDVGAIEAGRAADMIGIRMDRLEWAGGLHDPVASAVLCAPVGVDWSMINGREVVRAGRLTNLEIEPVIERHNTIARSLANRT